MDIRWRNLPFSALVILSALSLSTFGQLERPSECDDGKEFKPVLICYFGVVNLVEPPGNFSIRDFNASTCSHLVYSFATIDSESFTLKYPDGYSAIRLALKVKKIENPCLKTILAVGGAGADVSKTFRDAVRNENTTATLADSIAAEVAYTPWDGVDIDWEFPLFEDQQYFSRFMKILKCRLRCTVCGLNMRRSAEISIALSGSPFQIEGPGTETQGYNFLELNDYVDYYNIMAYDYHSFGPTDRQQKHHAPVYRHHTDNGLPNPQWERVNALDSIITLACAGADMTKMALGFPTYGRIWEMQFPWSHEYGRTAVGRGPAGSILGEPGVWTMSEFCLNLTTSKRQWTYVFDYEIMAPYAYTAENLEETYWFNYDDEITIIEKADLAFGNNRRYPAFTCPNKPGTFDLERLAGLMVWTTEYDDCNNICQGWVPCPLISAARKRLNFWYNKYRAEHEENNPTTTTTATEGPEPDPLPAESEYCKVGSPIADCPHDECKVKPITV